jgi:CRISPR-associated protein Csb2
MPVFLCVWVRFLDPCPMYRGRKDEGLPEWPPSPHRLFQAAVAAISREQQSAVSGLEWWEALPAPVIVAPRAAPGVPFRLSVPNNDLDTVANAWAKNREPKKGINELRTLKTVQAMHLPEGACVHYLWQVEDDSQLGQHRALLERCVRSITHLGWGIDMAVADVSVLSEKQAAELAGQRWLPTEGDSRNSLRVPVTGTLDDLNCRYAAFLERAQPESFKPVPPLSKFRLVSYLTGTEPPAMAFAAFSFLTPGTGRFRPFDPVRNGMRLAGMLRHAAGAEAVALALGWPDEKVKQMVHGHAEAEGEEHRPATGPRFAFIPLPTMEFRGKDSAEVVGSARRGLILGVRGASREEVEHLARLMAGASLTDEHTGDSAAILARLPESDSRVSRYTRASSTWATVTPVILPGHDDPRKYRRELSPGDGKDPMTAERQKRLLAKLDSRTDFLLRKAIRQAGFSEELARHAEIEWSGTGFLPGTDLASRYAIPATLRRFRRLHLRIKWRTSEGVPISLTGPLCLGSGRFVGLGLFVPVVE